jgi:hypothetical protein
MSDLTIFSQNLPAHLRTLELDDTTKALMGGGGGSKRISIKGGVFRMVVGGEEVARNEDRAMNVIIVAAAPKVSRTYYEGVYEEGVKAAPVCWSADGDKPDATAKTPQASSCANCPQNVKGSGQGDSRACRYSQRLAVVLENDINGSVYQLTLPAASVFGKGENGKWPLQTYAQMVASKGVPITSVVTEMRFDTSAQSPKLTFKPVRFLETDEFMAAVEQGKTLDAVRAITMTVAQSDGIESAPKAEKPKAVAAPKPVAAPKVEEPEEVEESEPEPKKVSTKKAQEEPAPKAKISSILSEWDDE